MEKSIETLFNKLNDIWNLSNDKRFKGEHPKCIEIQEEIVSILDKKSDDEILSILKSMNDDNVDQFEYIIEELIPNHSCLSALL